MSIRVFARTSGAGPWLLIAALFAMPAHARVKPHVEDVGSTAPRWITIAWHHSDNGVSGFMAQIQKPNGWQDAQTFEHTVAVGTVSGLTPDTTYTLRVCAMYGSDRATDWECSDPKIAKTMPPERPPSSANPVAPRIVAHDKGATHIGVKWEGATEYHSFFVNATRQERGRFHAPITIDHQDDGTWGYQRFDGLEPDTEYVMQVQGCRETLLGVGSDRCYAWSPAFTIRTDALPPPAPPATPELAVSAENASWIFVDWTVPASGVESLVLHVDGAVHKTFEPHYEAYRHATRPNTRHTYRLCARNAGGTSCSADVTGIGMPSTPGAPTGLTATASNYFPGVLGSANDMRSVPFVELSWRNSDIPGLLLAVERLEVRAEVSGNTVPRSIWSRGITRKWVEVKRISGAGDPTSAIVGAETVRPTGATPNEYRVCAIVPELGDAGRACSSTASL